jgi:acyl-CoA thioesterase
MPDLRSFFGGDRFAARNGIELLELEEGRALARLTVSGEHLNAAGVVQGGAVFTLADFAFAAASNSRGNVALAIEAHVTFLRAVREGVLLAEAREESGSRRLSTSSPGRLTGRTTRCRYPSSIGRRRTRFPVSAKSAFATAGAMGGSPGSPIPPGAAVLGRMKVSTLGISEIRSGSYT